MTFLQPSLLYGLFALAIPIIIHLFNFRRAKKIYFSNTQLLKSVKQVTSAKLKLKHWLILLSRLLFVLFLVLAFAQPFIPTSEDQSVGRDVIIYMDNSQSMSSETADSETFIDIALKTAGEVIKKYPADTKFKLLTNEVSGTGSFLTKEKMIDKITEVKLSPLSRTVSEIMRKFNSGTNPEGSRYFFISDFQKSTSGELTAVNPDTISSYSMVKVGGGKVGNIYVDSVFLEKPFLSSTEMNKLMVVLANSGENRTTNTVIKLSIGGSQVSTSSLTIPANGKATVPFDLSLDLAPFNKGQISIEDFPITFDNEFYFSLSTGNPVSVLEIKATASKTVVEQVFANKGLFRFNSFTAGNLSYSEIENANLVVLNGLSEIEPSLIPYLKNNLRSDGHLMIIPAASIVIESYQSLLPSLALTATEEEEQSLASLDLKNPFYENIFDTKNRNFEMPKVKPMLRWRRSGESLLKFKSGNAAMTRFNYKGKVYLWASPFEDAFTNFHKHALFVPVMYRIATSSLMANERLYYNVNELVFSIKLDSLESNNIYRFERQEGDVLIPEQRINGNELVVGLPKELIKPGFYDLKLGDEIKDQLAFNASSAESILEYYEADFLSQVWGVNSAINVYGVDNPELFGSEVEKAHFGIELWKYCLILCLLFLFVEVILLRVL